VLAQASFSCPVALAIVLTLANRQLLQEALLSWILFESYLHSSCGRTMISEDFVAMLCLQDGTMSRTMVLACSAARCLAAKANLGMTDLRLDLPQQQHFARRMVEFARRKSLERFATSNPADTRPSQLDPLLEVRASQAAIHLLDNYEEIFAPLCGSFRDSPGLSSTSSQAAVGSAQRCEPAATPALRSTSSMGRTTTSPTLLSGEFG